MSSYKHLTIEERENILILQTKGQSIRNIAKSLDRSPSTISRELAKNTKLSKYSPNHAQMNYIKNKEKCGRKPKFSSITLYNIVKKLFIDFQWSPEQISQRLKIENPEITVSYSTIYRAIYRGIFNPKGLNTGNRGCIKLLRHKGKTRHTKKHIERRGKIRISNSIHVRPEIINTRSRIGDWEADTVSGKTGHACLVTLVDRKTGYLLCGKITKKTSALVADKIVELLGNLPKHKRCSITPDRGKEFARHDEVTQTLDNIPFYFPDPHAPWQRGTNENTNGLIREYIAKGVDIDNIMEKQIDQYVKKLNTRPRKRLNWKTPHELFNHEVLHLI